MFIKTIDGSGEFKDKHYIVGVLKDAIKEIGHEKVVQVNIDNAIVMKSAGALIESEYPKIFWTPCVVHTLNLVLKNICAAKMRKRMKLHMKNVVGLHVLLMMHPSYVFLL